MAYKQGIISYDFVVGPTGNYPPTSIGLQNAVNAAESAAGGNYFVVFIQAPGISDAGTVTLPDKCVLTGAVSEMPATAYSNNDGEIVFETDTTLATTVLDVVFNFPNDGHVKFYNLCWASSTADRFFPIGDGDATLIQDFFNCWVQCNNTIYMIGLAGNHTTGTTNLNINLDNSYISQNVGGLADISSGSGGSVNVSMTASNSSVVGSTGQGPSSLYNSNCTYTLSLNSGSIYADGMTVGGTTTNDAVTYHFNDCLIISKFNIPFLAADGSFSDINIYQNNVTYYADSTSVGIDLFSSIGGVNGVDVATNINLKACVWGDLQQTADDFFNYQIDNSFSVNQALFSKTAEVLDVGYDKRSVGGTAMGSQLLFTVDNPDYNTFCPTNILIALETETTFMSAPTVSVGTNSPTYDNILTATPLTLSASGEYINLPVGLTTSAGVSTSATGVYINVSVAAVADVYSMRVQTTGHFA